MKLHPLVLALALTSLAGCGGGGDTTPETKSALNLMLTTYPEDQLFASAQSGEENLSLFKGIDLQGETIDALIYSDSSDQVSFLNKSTDSSYKGMIINGYQFDSMATASGTEIIVTAPSGEQETYYVDGDGQLLEESNAIASRGGLGDLFEGNPFDTSACNDNMYDNDEAWSTCTDQQINAFVAGAQDGFTLSSIFSKVIEIHHDYLLPAFNKAKAFIADVKAKASFSSTVATPKEYISNGLNQASELASSMRTGLNKFFNELKDGIIEENNSELETLLGEVWQSAKKQVGYTTPSTDEQEEEPEEEPEEPEEPIIGKITCTYQQTLTQEDLDCTAYDIEGVVTATRSESIYKLASYNYTSNSLSLTEFHNLTQKQEEWGLTISTGDADSAGDINDRKVTRSHTLSDMDYQGTSDMHYLAVFTLDYNDGYPMKRILVAKEEDGIASEDFQCQENGAMSYYYDKLNDGTILDVSQCPYDLAESETEKVHSLGKQDMWLVTGEYQQYLE